MPLNENKNELSELNRSLHRKWSWAQEIERRDLADEVLTQVVKANKGLVRDVVRPWTSVVETSFAADYYQAGVLGLVNAFQRWNPAKGGFYNFALVSVKGEVHREVRRCEFAHMSQTDFNARKHVLEEEREREQQARAGSIPSDQPTVAEALNLSPALVRRAMAPAPLSLDEELPWRGESAGTKARRKDRLEARAAESLDLEKLFEEIAVNDALDVLPIEQLWVVVERFGLAGGPNRSLVEVADSTGRGREIVRRTEAKALSTLRASLLPLA